MVRMASEDVEHIRRLIDGLRRDRRTHPQRGRREYSQRARQVAEACEELLAVEPAAVLALTRRAVERVTTALTYLDDSNGGIGDDLHGLMRLHARACAAAPPEPKRLARWLASMRLDGPGWPDFELHDFATALGQTGRDELARLVDERLSTAEPDAFGRTPFGVRSLREQLAEISGDVHQHIAVLAEDLRTADQYRKIVDALRHAGRAHEAERWANRGLTELANPLGKDTLRNVYIDLLLDRGAQDEALALRQDVFHAHPTRAHYRDLRGTAERTGDWPQLHARAINRLRDAAADRPGAVDHLILVLLDEDEHARAWQVATEYPDALGASRWYQLIELRQETHPGQVIEPLQRLIEQRLGDSRDKYRSKRAVTMLRRLRDAHHAVGNPARFASYLDDLRDRHRRKTAFLATLERAKL